MNPRDGWVVRTNKFGQALFRKVQVLEIYDHYPAARIREKSGTQRIVSQKVLVFSRPVPKRVQKAREKRVTELLVRDQQRALVEQCLSVEPISLGELSSLRLYPRTQQLGIRRIKFGRIFALCRELEREGKAIMERFTTYSGRTKHWTVKKVEQ